MSYLNGFIWDNNYGIRDTLFNNVPKSKVNFDNVSFNEDGNTRWILTQLPLQERAFQDVVPKKLTKTASEMRNVKKAKKLTEKKIKKIHKGKNKIKKCFLKLFKKKGKKGKKFGKHMLPLIFGLMLAKSVLIPIILKTLAFISVKGLMMGFFSTVLASMLSLKTMFGSHGYQSRIDDANTRVEIIRLPKNDYYDDNYSRRDLVPIYKRISYN